LDGAKNHATTHMAGVINIFARYLHFHVLS
jgi:hypothetical protein